MAGAPVAHGAVSDHADSLAPIAADLIERHGRGHTPFGLYVVASRDAAADLALSVEREVFLEFFGNTPELLADEYDPYEASSLFLVVVDHHRRVPAGMMRVIVPSPAGLKSVDDLARIWGDPHPSTSDRGRAFEARHAWDIATLAVAPDYRGGASLVSLALYQALAGLVTAASVEWLIAVLDTMVLDLIQTRLGRPFSFFDGIEPRRYLDSPWSLPVFMDVSDYRERLRFVDRATYEMVFEGAGLGAAVSSPSWDHGIEIEAAVAIG